MKIILNFISLLLFLLIQQVVVGQSKEENKYIVPFGKELYNFEVKETTYSCVLKCKDGEGKAIPATLDSCSISSISDYEELLIAVEKLTKKAGQDGVSIANKLGFEYKQRQQTKELQTKIARLEDDKGALIGTISIKAAKVNACLYSNTSIDDISTDTKKIRFLITIQSVDISFENGIIKDLLVKGYSKKKITDTNILKDTVFYFSNSTYIPIRNAKDVDGLSTKAKNYVSFIYDHDSIIVIDLADIINYSRKIPYATGTYIPDDTTLSITIEKPETISLFKPSMSESFDIRIYSDLLGLNNTKAPNGIIQAEAQLVFNLNQGKNKSSLQKIWNRRNGRLRRSQFVFFNRISPYFKLTKIENTNNTLRIDSLKHKNLLEVFKYANLNVGTELNIATYRTDSKMFAGNIGLGILRTKMGNDSIPDKNITLSTVYANPNIDFQFFESNKIDFNLRFGIYYAWILSPLDTVAVAKEKKPIRTIVSTSNNWWLQCQQSINLHPNGNKQSSIFIRASQYYGLLSEENHFTFQIGYSTSFSNLLKF